MGEFSYEDTMNRISEIIDKLESEEVGLNDSYNLFIEARDLIDKCEKYLNICEEKFEIILEDVKTVKEEEFEI